VALKGLRHEKRGIARRHVSHRSLLLALSVLAIFSTPAAAIKEKKLVNPVTTEPADGTVADFVADQVTYDPRTKLAVATGKVIINYGPYVLTATRVTYNETTDKFTANGSVVLKEPNGNVLEADETELTNRFKEGFARKLKALLNNDVTITAEYAKRKLNGITIYEKARYTACKNCQTRSGEPLWELVSKQTTHDDIANDFIHINPRLKIGGVTVGGLPYLRHPDTSVKRRTGWLPPKFYAQKTYGLGVEAPFFWAFAPDKDITFRPRITSSQGLLADAEYRQRTQTGLFSVRAMGIYELSPGKTDEDDRWRGAVSTKGDFKASKTLSWGWKGVLPSDRTFLRNYDLDNRRIAQNEIYARNLSDRDYVSAQLLSFDPLRTTVDDESLPTALPYMWGEHFINDPVMGGELSVNWSAYSIARDQSGQPFTDVNHGTEQSRATADLHWKTRYISDGGFLLTPFMNLRSDIYVTNNLADPTVLGGEREQETTTRLLPSAGLDFRYPLISNHEYGQSIVSPVMQIIAAGNEKEADSIANEDAITLNFDHTSLFLEDRFTGYDRYESGTRVNAGFTYSFLGKNGGFLRASAGESFHIAGENSFVEGSGLDGSSSDLVAALTFQPWDNIALSYEVRAEEDLSAINRQEVFGSLTFDRFSVNASYMNINAEPSYGRVVDEQWAAADFRVALKDGWYLFGGGRYDIENSFLAKRSLGIEFDCDCMNFKVAYTGTDYGDNYDFEHRVMMSIDLATLGGTSLSTRF
jgi:LPS-assembly protein